MECYILDYVQRFGAGKNKSSTSRLSIKLIFHKSNVSAAEAHVSSL